MSKHLKYAWYLIQHKFWVIVYGVKLKVSCGRIIFHDMSKFLPDEWFPYANHFYGSGDSRFEIAWLKHFIRNDHHWDHWCYYYASKDAAESFPMSESAVREMIADWMSVGKIKGNNVIDWYEQNRGRMNLHRDTRTLVETILRMECR